MRMLLVFCLAVIANSQDIVFEHVNVIPMNSETLLKDHSVLVKDGRFVDVVPASKIKIPAGAIRVDGKGKYLAPGLGEMHGHIPPPNAPAGFIEDVLFLYVANGVTTVRGMLGHPGQLELREKAKRNEIVSPTLYLAGPSFSGTSVTSVSQAIARVKQQKEEGWDLLKIHPGLTREQFDAVAKTAREVGIPFAGHVPTAVSLLHALEQKQETIDHLDGYIEYLDESKVSMDEVAARTKAAGAWVVPTMVLWETILGVPDLAALQSFTENKYMPRTQVEQWVKTYQARRASPQFDLAKVQRVAADRKRLLKTLHTQKVKIIFGTDAPQQFSVPGFSAHREMKSMIEAGMKPYDVLRSGTASVGEYYKGKDRFGTIAKGMRADAVLLDGNPLEDIGNFAKIAGVLVRGKWMPGSEIETRLKNIADKNRP